MDLDELIPSRYRGLVAVEVSGAEAELFFHEGDGFRTERVEFHPFLLTGESAAADGSDPAAVIELDGDSPLKWRIDYASIEALEAAVKLLTSRGEFFSVIRDYTQQALTVLESRLFSGMTFPELRRMQWEIVFDGDEVAAVETADSGGGRERFDTGSEKERLEALLDITRRWDPDVIEGYGLCDEVLSRLLERFRFHRIRAEFGRGGGGFTKRPGRLSFGERTLNFNRFDLRGRHIVDLAHLALRYDVGVREFDSFEPAALAQYFHLEETGARLIGALCAIFTPSDFYRARILPLKYQDVICRGNGSSLDALFCAEYLRSGAALPLPERPQNFQGAMTRAEVSGVFRNVWHCDVRSLYPSLIIANSWTPKRDRLGIYLRLLRELRDFRLEARRNAAEAGNVETRRHFQTLQSAFKILINSFYGYLGFPQGTFNDYELAARVTAAGREVLGTLLDFLTRRGAGIIEADTDGVYFQPPADAGAPADFERELQAALPTKITIELDEFFQAMFAYKSKNYALLTAGGDVRISGAALKSRAYEPFRRNFIREVVTRLLTGRGAEIPALRDEYRERIAGHLLPLRDLAKSETLGDSTANYRRKLASGTGRRSAAYELAIAAGRELRAGAQVFFYVTGDKKKPSITDSSRLLDANRGERDENVVYYLNQLEELYANFSGFIEKSAL